MRLLVNCNRQTGCLDLDRATPSHTVLCYAEKSSVAAQFLNCHALHEACPNRGASNLQLSIITCQVKRTVFKKPKSKTLPI
jgi:hypothetical protein